MEAPELLSPPLLFFLERSEIMRMFNGWFPNLNTEIFKVIQNNSLYPFKYLFKNVQHV